MKPENVVGLFIEVNPRTAWITGIRLTATDDQEARAVVQALSQITTRAAWLWLKGLFTADRMVVKRRLQGGEVEKAR